MLDAILGTWSDALRSASAGLIAYVAVVVFVRAGGKRAVAKWNAFDLIVTVALGSSLASTVASGTITVLNGLGSFVVLLLLQFAVTWLSVRLRFVNRLVKASPSLLVRDGHFDRETMRRERVTEDEVLAAVRRRGFGDLRVIEAVVLETDGSFSVIERTREQIGYSTLRDVRRERDEDGSS